MWYRDSFLNMRTGVLYAESGIPMTQASLSVLCLIWMRVRKRLSCGFTMNPHSHANDRRKTCWANKSQNTTLQPKLEGVSLMVADFVSANYGWLCSPDAKETPMSSFVLEWM